MVHDEYGEIRPSKVGEAALVRRMSDGAQRGQFCLEDGLAFSLSLQHCVRLWLVYIAEAARIFFSEAITCSLQVLAEAFSTSSKSSLYHDCSSNCLASNYHSHRRQQQQGTSFDKPRVSCWSPKLSFLWGFFDALYV